MKVVKIPINLVAAALVFGAFCTAAQASPTVVDLTSSGSEGTIGGAIFRQFDPTATGTGNIDPFVRIQVTGSGAEAGYNTDGTIEFETKDDGGHNWTHSLLLSDVPIVDINGTNYREFVLDIDEAGQGQDHWKLSLDELKIHLESTGNLSGYPTNFSNPIYDLDGIEDSWIMLNYSLNGGSGQGDMLAYIPDSLFTGGDYVYLYSMLGATAGWVAEDGFEEWAVQTSIVIPAPGAILLGGIGVCLVGWLRRRRAL